LPYLYFITSFIGLMLTYVAINSFTIIVYPSDVREADKSLHETQVIAEKVLKNIKDSYPFQLCKGVIIMLGCVTCISFLHMCFILYSSKFLSRQPPPPPPPAPSHPPDEVRVNMLQVYKNNAK
jgi:hypothetical protein